MNQHYDHLQERSKASNDILNDITSTSGDQFLGTNKKVGNNLSLTTTTTTGSNNNNKATTNTKSTTLANSITAAVDDKVDDDDDLDPITDQTFSSFQEENFFDIPMSKVQDSGHHHHHHHVHHHHHHGVHHPLDGQVMSGQ